MLKRANVLLFAALAGLAVTNARAEIVVATFDDLTTGLVLVPTPYAGINWQGNWYSYSNPQDPYNAHSGDNRLILFGDGVVETKFSFYQPVFFDGAWIAGGGAETPGVSFNLYLGATLVGSSSTLIESATSTFLDSGYTGWVDSVGVVGEAGRFAMDDVTYHTPEPALALPTLGLLGFWIARHRRRRIGSC
jgi:hypothetical protein